MITDITVDNEYVLIYNGTELKSGTLTTGQVTSPFDVEVFDTVQEILDQGIALGLICNTEYQLQLMEHGAIIPEPHMSMIKAGVIYMDIGHQIRMVALGHATEDQIGSTPDDFPGPPV